MAQAVAQTAAATAAADPALPHLATALDPVAMSRHLGTPVDAATLMRHKPGKRAMVRYETGMGPLLAKMRAGHRATSPAKLLSQFRARGFDDDASDGISVPAPVTVVDELELWVQRLVPGVSAERLAASGADRAVLVAERAAEAASKIHRADVPTKRVHTPVDEGRILQQRLAEATISHPRLTVGLAEVRWQARRLVSELERMGRPVAGIHRDYYADQLLIDGDRVTVCDFDLYCAGDPAVDIGNFAAHLTELALRVLGDPDALADAERALVAVYRDAAGPGSERAIEIYAALTLARHISLSTQIQGRGHLTEGLVELSLRRCRAT